LLDEHSRLTLVRRHYAAYNAHDIEAQMETLDPEIEVIAFDHAGHESEHWRGLDEARDFFVGIRAVIADSAAEIVVMRPDGDRVFVRLVLSGELRGTGDAGAIEAVHLHSFSEDGIAKIQTYRPNWRGGGSSIRPSASR